MMFISTVVHLFEFILLSLLGIMLYKLFASYKKWKNMSVSSSSKGGDRTDRIVKPFLPQNPDYLSISKITVTEEHSASQPAQEKQSSVILTDYIGEFFTESKPMNLEPFRAKPSEHFHYKEDESTDESTDEIIQVKSVILGPALLVQESPSSNTDSPDAYITVSSDSNELSANNMMSDKVVMAMLDEAKLVCAS